MKARSSKYLQSVQSPGNLRPAQLIQFARKTQVYTQIYYSDLSIKCAAHLIIFEKTSQLHALLEPPRLFIF